MNLKRIALTALLIAVIAAAAVFTVNRMRAEQSGPTLFADQKFEKIDVNSFEVFAETTRDWETKYAPDASGNWKNPRTGEYTMVEAIKCASCGQFIPVPKMPAELQAKAGLPTSPPHPALPSKAEPAKSRSGQAGAAGTARRGRQS